MPPVPPRATRGTTGGTPVGQLRHGLVVGEVVATRPNIRIARVTSGPAANARGGARPLLADDEREDRDGLRCRRMDRTECEGWLWSPVFDSAQGFDDVRTFRRGRAAERTPCKRAMRII